MSLSIAGFREHLGLAGREWNKEWRILKDALEDSIYEYMDLSPNGPTMTRQLENAESALLKVFRTQPKYFPDHRRAYDRKLVLSYISKRVGALRFAIKHEEDDKEEKAALGTIEPSDPFSPSSSQQGGLSEGSPLAEVDIPHKPPRFRRERSDTPDRRHASNSYHQRSNSSTYTSSPYIVRGNGRDRPPARDQERTSPYFPQPAVTVGTAQQCATLHLSQIGARDELHDFLATCRPPLLHLYPVLIAAGWKNISYVRAAAKWPREWLSRAMKLTRLNRWDEAIWPGDDESQDGADPQASLDMEARREQGERIIASSGATPADWYVLEYHIWRLGQSEGS